MKDKSIREITRMICDLFDIVYFSGRKFGFARGGGLGAHIDAMDFVSHIPQQEYPAGALACALYICGGIRGMERGTLSEERNADGSERFASMELLRRNSGADLRLAGEACRSL